MRWVSVAIVLGVLAGCAAQPPSTGAAEGPPTPPPQPSADDASPASPAAAASLVDEYGNPVVTLAEPTWDEASTTAVLEASDVVMRAFARPDLAYEQWWAELAPLLSPKAQMDYQYVDPANIPVRTVTGEPVLVDDASASVAGVRVPTDVGDYLVTLSRATADPVWVVERLTPPAGL